MMVVASKATVHNSLETSIGKMVLESSEELSPHLIYCNPNYEFGRG